MAPITRRDFLRLSALGAAALALPWPRGHRLASTARSPLPEFPASERLGRAFTKVEIKARPDFDSDTVSVIYDDAIVPWLRETVGPRFGRYRQRWVETDGGFIWASELQPVRNLLNVPLAELPVTSLGAGMWVEVTVPYVDIVLDNPPARAPWLKGLIELQFPLRLYYSQVLWVDALKTDAQGQAWYRVNEQFGYGDIFWAAAEAFRPLTPEDLAPISPDVEDKRVVVNVNERFQTLSCFEGQSEVFFTTVSAGKKFDADGNPRETSSTPLGKHYIWRKQVSTHMSGGTTGGGYDLPGIGWTTLFIGSGVALHSTFWHNNFGGELMSHGCVNLRPEDALWVFRWTAPHVPYDPGDLTIQGVSSTPIIVMEE